MLEMLLRNSTAMNGRVVLLKFVKIASPGQARASAVLKEVVSVEALEEAAAGLAREVGSPAGAASEEASEDEEVSGEATEALQPPTSQRRRTLLPISQPLVEKGPKLFTSAT